MAKSTSSSNLFAGFNPPKVDKKAPHVVDIVEVEQSIEKSKEEPQTTQEHKEEIDVLVKQEVRKIMESQQVQSNKIGRPKKYMTSTKVISVRIDSDAYEFVRKKGRLEYDGITDYINHLIREEMVKC